MIKELFLPEKFGAHRLIARRIVGMAVHDDMVRAVLVHAKRNKTFVEQVYSLNIPTGVPETLNERTIATIKEVIAQFKNYHQVRVTIPASIVIFKELTLQFNDPEKIRMVLDYEVETMLPFAIDEAVIDFIITKTNKETLASDVLVAAVRNQDLQDHLTLYQQAGIEPTCVSIDLFSVYGLYQQIPEYNDLTEATALVEFGYEATRVAFVQHGQLKLTRYIQRGLSHVLKFIHEETHIEIAELEKKLATGGLQNETDEVLRRSVQSHFILLFNDIQFTLNSFSLKLNFNEGINKILFTGPVCKIKEFTAFFSSTMQIPSESFDVPKVFTSKHLKNKVKEKDINWLDYVVALGVAVPSEQQSIFNLRRKQFAVFRDTLIARQLAVGASLIFLMFFSIGVKGYLDIGKLSGQISDFETKQIGLLKAEKIFPKGRFPVKPVFVSIVREADKIVREKLDIWSPFTQMGRMNPLDYWLEVVRIINKKQYNVAIKEFSITTQEKGWEKDLDGTTKKDVGRAKIEIEGLFKSKIGEHFQDFMGIFENNRFRDSVVLKVIDPIETISAPEGGVGFTVRFIAKTM